MKNMLPLRLLVALVSCIMMTACGSGGNNSGGGALKTGTLSLGLTDASTDEYRAVYITIDEVQVYTGGDEEDPDNWETVAVPMETFNLLELVNGVIAELGTSSLDAESYGQLRIIFGTTPTDGMNILNVGHPYASYVIDMNSQSHELKIPGGIATGVKIVHDFDISEDQTTELILDFDASASVVKASTRASWLMKPTLKVLNAEEAAIVSGIVSDPDTEDGIENARISLQYETPDPEDPMDAVTVQAATVSDTADEEADIASGEYTLLVKPGSYRLVAYKDGYAVGCYVIEAAADETTVRDVELAASATGAVEGIVTVAVDGDPSEQYATLSFRQPAECKVPDEEGTVEDGSVEVRSVNIRSNMWYGLSLPVGTYSLAASGSGMITEVYDGIEVEDSGVVYRNVSLGND